MKGSEQNRSVAREISVDQKSHAWSAALEVVVTNAWLSTSSFANATAAKPIFRGTAERVLREFIDRVNAVNASKEYAFKIKSAVLFGSMLSCADRLGDIDVAIDLQRRISDSAKFRQQCDRRRHLAEEQGRVFSTAFDWATWPKKEVVLQLKARSRSLSLHGFEQLMEMENLHYRILVGNANLIASQIPTGCAV